MASTAPGNPPKVPQPPPLLENLECCHFWLRYRHSLKASLDINYQGYINFRSQELQITYSSLEPPESKYCIMVLGDDLYRQKDGVWQQESDGFAYFEKVRQQIWQIVSKIPSPEGLRNPGPRFFDERIVTLPEEDGKEAYLYDFQPQFGDSYYWKVGVEDKILRSLSYSEYLGTCSGKQISLQITQINQAIVLHPPIADSPTDSIHQD